jgi:glucan phosphoethanolaminetransferase (alkaline phosphatase superfamily)|tara:strand:+ start:424 stop:900 length:477 start_codon:yes stop_codon:yes gene_type:complete
MNDAHYHLIVNHLPIVGLLIGILVLIAGLVFNKAEVKLTALGIFIFSATTSIAAFYTGEGAEEVIENLEGISETLIHTHEEYAETFFTLTLILGGLSLLTFILELKKMKFTKYLMILCLLIALVDGVLATYVGSSGGEIRHSEIRNDAKMIPLDKYEE